MKNLNGSLVWCIVFAVIASISPTHACQVTYQHGLLAVYSATVTADNGNVIGQCANAIMAENFQNCIYRIYSECRTYENERKQEAYDDKLSRAEALEKLEDSVQADKPCGIQILQPDGHSGRFQAKEECTHNAIEFDVYASVPSDGTECYFQINIVGGNSTILPQWLRVDGLGSSCARMYNRMKRATPSSPVILEYKPESFVKLLFRSTPL